MNDKWIARFTGMARLVAGWSKDPSTKCGAVIVDDKRRVVSVGFNGFPRGTDDAPDLYNNRAVKYLRVIHAEKNAILFARRDLSGCAIFVWPMPPCSQCAAAIIQSGISLVAYPALTDDNAERWGDSFNETRLMFHAAKIETVTL